MKTLSETIVDMKTKLTSLGIQIETQKYYRRTNIHPIIYIVKSSLKPYNENMIDPLKWAFIEVCYVNNKDPIDLEEQNEIDKQIIQLLSEYECIDNSNEILKTENISHFMFKVVIEE